MHNVGVARRVLVGSVNNQSGGSTTPSGSLRIQPVWSPEGDVHQSSYHEWASREGGYLLRSTTQIVVLLSVVTGLLMSCSTAPSTSGGRDELLQQATASMSEMSREDPGLDELARRAYGYALFPEVAKGGLVFGGAYGRGVVYEQGQ